MASTTAPATSGTPGAGRRARRRRRHRRRAAKARAIVGRIAAIVATAVIAASLAASSDDGRGDGASPTSRIAESGSPSLPATAGEALRDFDAVLERYVDGRGEVDYAGLARDRVRLDRFVAWVASTSPDRHPERFPTERDRLAFWINAYNALMLARVADAWPIASVEEILPWHGVFWLERHTVGGATWSLHALETEVIRGRFREPRIHFVVNCASRGCPPLLRRAMRGATLESDLAAAERTFLDSPDHVRVDLARSTIELSSLLDWYRDDFVAWTRADDLAAWLSERLPPESLGGRSASAFTLRFVPYDWSVNARGSR